MISDRIILLICATFLAALTIICVTVAQVETGMPSCLEIYTNSQNTTMVKECS